MSGSNRCFLTCMQISQDTGQVVWYFHLLKYFPQFVLIHTVKGFGIVNKAEVNVFLELSCFVDDPVDVGNIISGNSAFSKSSLNIWNFMVRLLLKPGLEDFEHYFACMWDECSCAVVWTFFCIAFSISLMSWKSYIENLLWDFLVHFGCLSKFSGGILNNVSFFTFLCCLVFMCKMFPF